MPSAKAGGISFITLINDKLSLTPTAMAIETVNPISAKRASLNANFIPEATVCDPDFVKDIPSSLPASKPINTQVVLIGTLECSLK